MGNIISVENEILNVPDYPVIPFIEGDGIGPEIWQLSVFLILQLKKHIKGKEK